MWYFVLHLLLAICAFWMGYLLAKRRFCTATDENVVPSKVVIGLVILGLVVCIIIDARWQMVVIPNGISLSQESLLETEIYELEGEPIQSCGYWFFVSRDFDEDGTPTLCHTSDKPPKEFQPFRENGNLILNPTADMVRPDYAARVKE